ncbi:GNAT family N-acetyltransferase [Marinicella meishanensis]|uniref:GNAT family N-acetyltransferase n=1 Tax=Marinicella meishanensis TaxID=2873263 RepID=UPI001CC1A7A4|nr:GNAT family N-acetyltransferase [Marinicella sp. NBU2979]
MVEVQLLAVGITGELLGETTHSPAALPAAVRQLNQQMADFYHSEGFQPPWLGYVSVLGEHIVGGGAFKSPPAHGRVEIAYYTLPEFEGQGCATATAQALIDLAIKTDETLTVVAQTLPETNASNHLLQKLGFRFFDVVDHPDDGPVWEWHLF